MQKPAHPHPSADLEVQAPVPLSHSGAHSSTPHSTPPKPEAPREIGGPSGPEPTRYGDWERNGRCIDF